MKYTRIFLFIILMVFVVSCGSTLFDVPLSWKKIATDEFTGMWIKNGYNDDSDTLIIRKVGNTYKMIEHYSDWPGKEERLTRDCNAYLTKLNGVWFLNSYHHQIGPYNVSKIEIKDDSLMISDIDAYSFFSDYRDDEDNVYRVEDPVTFRQVVRQNMYKDGFFESPTKYWQSNR